MLRWGDPRSAPGPLSHPQVPPAWWPRCAPPMPGSGGCSRGCSRPPAAHQPVAAAAAAAAVSGSEPEKRRASRPRGGGGSGRVLPARSPAAPGAGAPSPEPRRSSLPRTRPTYALASLLCTLRPPESTTKPAGSGSAPSTRSWPWEDPDPRPQEAGEVPAQPWCPGPDHVWNHRLLDRETVFQEEGFGFLIDRSPTLDSFPDYVTLRVFFNFPGPWFPPPQNRGTILPSGDVGFSEARRWFLQGTSPNFSEHPS